VNWSEVAQKIKQKGMDITTVRCLLEELGLIIAPFSLEQAEIAAHLWDQGKAFGLSLADRACLALAMQQQSPVFTADRVWVKLKLDIDIRLLR
jgi:PIN domain nuclease of toxin-antitoxin system